MDAVKEYGGTLQFASEDLKRNKEIVMAAVKQYWRGLEFASWSFRVTVMLFLRQRSITAIHYSMQI